MKDYSFSLAIAVIVSIINPSLCGVPVDPLVTDLVYLDIDIDGSEVGRIIIGLFGGTTPKTVQNFISLAKHEYGYGYRKSLFHRIIPNFMMQGGDFTNGDGTGGYSIYGPQFKDENFIHRHYGAGWVCMANAGTDTNGSQFYITFIETPWIDRSHTCFGKVVSGMNVVRKCEAVATDGQDKPVTPVEIYDSGILHLRKSYLVELSDALVDKDELDDDNVDITEYDESEYEDNDDTDYTDDTEARLNDEL